jgi:hypothetical protein
MSRASLRPIANSNLVELPDQGSIPPEKKLVALKLPEPPWAPRKKTVPRRDTEPAA